MKGGNETLSFDLFEELYRKANKNRIVANWEKLVKGLLKDKSRNSVEIGI